MNQPDMKEESSVIVVVDRLKKLYDSFYELPFPSADCRAVSLGHEEWDDLVGDLNTYSADISALASRSMGLFKMPYLRQYQLLRYARKTFFERYPIYANLPALLATGQYQELSSFLDMVEEIRSLAVPLLALATTRRTGRE